jgi:hypothetical protein
LFIGLSLGLSTFEIASVGSYSYWISREWRTLHSDKKIGEVFYIGLLLLVTILFSLIPLKLLFR